MMAKMFYTLEEAKTALGKTEEDIKQLAREGRLREFRDGPRLMFKADQVEQLKAEAGSPENVDLGVSDSGGLIGLVDTTGASGTSITLSEGDTGQSSGAGMQMKDDTALAADLGLSGSMGGIPSPGRGGTASGGSVAGLTGTGIGLAGTGAGGSVAGASGTGTAGGTAGLSGTGTGRSPGINVFGDTDFERSADPSAQTNISSTVREPVNLEGVGSGSGLLDLTRESDDTSLGAVLDEIGPSGSATARRPGIEIGEGTGLEGMDEPTINRGPAIPVYTQRLDPMAPAFAAASLAGFIMALFGIYVLVSAVTGVQPDVVNSLALKGLWMIFGIGLALAVVLFLVGLVAGKVGQR